MNCLNWYNISVTHFMKYIVTVIFIIVAFNSKAQILQKEFKGNFLVTDQFGFYYEIKDTEINKYSKDGKLNCSYSNNVLGVIANVDVSNPYKVLVYFRDFTKIVILDNTLSPTSEVIDLTSIDLDETNLVCRSYNEGMWYYDPVRFELIRKNQELETTNNSGNLANLLGKNIQPNFLIEYNNKIYLNDTTNGILVFDLYGTYMKTIPLYGLQSFQVKDKYLIYSSSKGEIELYDFFTLEIMKYQPLKYNSITAVRLENKLLYLVNKNNSLVIDKIAE